MSEQKMDLIVINNRLTSTIGFVKQIFGDKLSPVPIVDEKVLNSAQENVVTLMDLKKCVVDYFKPRKEEAKKPYQELLDSEKKWLTTIDEVRAFVDDQIKDFNDRKRIEIQAREQAEQAERAAAERARMEADKAEALAAGNEELAQQIVEAQQNTVAIDISEKKIMNRNDLSTMSESATIEDFEIINHQQFAMPLMEGGNGGMVILDKKVETAFKKYLLTNKDVKGFPGVKFRRDYKVIHRTR